jgi:hypothetical protein
MTARYAKKLHTSLKSLMRDLHYDTTNAKHAKRYGVKPSNIFPCDEENAGRIREELKAILDRYPLPPQTIDLP